MAEPLKYEDLIAKIERLFAQTKFATLAYIKSGVPHTAQMCLISDGLDVYMQTDAKFDKTAAIRENPNVAINIGAFNFTGCAEIAGHPSESSWYINAIKEKHPDTHLQYTNLPDEVLLKITLTNAKIWGKVEGQECLRLIDFSNKTIKKIAVEC